MALKDLSGKTAYDLEREDFEKLFPFFLFSSAIKGGENPLATPKKRPDFHSRAFHAVR